MDVRPSSQSRTSSTSSPWRRSRPTTRSPPDRLRDNLLAHVGRRCRFRVPGCPPLSRRGTPASTRLPARSRSLALHLASRKGVPAPPLRFDPGTPFLDQHITDVYGEARCRVVNGERAGSSRLTAVNKNY